MSTTLTSIRTADFAGKISWKTCKTYEGKINNTYYSLYVQKPMWFAVVEKVIYKKWRVVMKKKSQKMAARVVAECNTKKEALRVFEEIINLFREGFIKRVADLSYLDHGDIISVPTKMIPGGGLRHFGVFDKENNQVIEYQSGGGSCCKGSIQSTPFSTFTARVRAKYKGKLDLRKHEYIISSGQWFSGYNVVRRARRCIGTRKYNAVFRNCETFAVWCKTGKKQSIQSLEKMELFYDKGIKVAIAASAIVIVVGIGIAVVSTGGAAAAPIATAGAEITAASVEAATIAAASTPTIGTTAITAASTIGTTASTAASTIGTTAITAASAIGTPAAASTAMTAASTIGTTTISAASSITATTFTATSTIGATTISAISATSIIGAGGTCTALGAAKCGVIGSTGVLGVSGVATFGALVAHNMISTTHTAPSFS